MLVDASLLIPSASVLTANAPRSQFSETEARAHLFESTEFIAVRPLLISFIAHALH